MAHTNKRSGSFVAHASYVKKGYAMNTQRLYSPLTIYLEEANECNQEDDNDSRESDPTPLFSGDAIKYSDAIKAAIKKDYADYSSRGLMDFFDSAVYPNIDKKVHAITNDVAVHNGGLFGVTILALNKPLIPSEFDVLKEYITGQFSDGWGEGFEQRPIKTEEGELFVSFWGYPNWQLIEEKDFLRPNEVSSIQQTSEKTKPDAPMINADGNIFYQMGIASKALKRNGQHDQAKDMIARVCNADNYTEALAIICEYVNPVNANELNLSKSDKASNKSR
jgi:hypothetical protein